MTTTVYKNGRAEFAVTDTFKIAATSLASFKVYQDTGYPNLPSTWDLIKTTTDGETYTSAAFTPATTLRIDAGHADVFYDLGTAPSIATPVAAISGSADPFPLAGLGDTQGGAISVTGGTSSTSANDGGAASVAGGLPGATGDGGAASVTGGIGGATSGAGGAASLTGGAGTLGDSVGGAASVTGGAASATNAAGGVASATGGAGAGTGNGGAASQTGGAAGATGTGGASDMTGGAATAGAGGASGVTGGAGGTTGNGGAASLTGGASGTGATGNGGAANATGADAASTDGNGGNVILTGGALAGTGIDGHIKSKTLQVGQQAAPSAHTTAATVTIANLLVGILTGTHTAGATQGYTLPTGTDADAGVQFDNDDYFDWTILNLSAAAADTITITANTAHTIVGNPIVQSAHVSTGGITGNSVTFRTRKTAANTYVTYCMG